MNAELEQSARSVAGESPALFGPDGNLVGILSRPESPRPVPAVLFLNAGVVHRVGPHRLHVVLARALAARGWTSLRLDLSGIGDSRAFEGTESFRERAVIDVRAAMDHLASEVGIEEFVLFGLCAGADNGVATALVDPRVVGLVLVDQITYATRRSRLRKVLARARTVEGLRPALGKSAEAARRLARKWLRRVEPMDRAVAEEPTQNGRVGPPASEHGEHLERLVRRGVDIFAVYSGGNSDRYNGPGQLFEIFPALRGRVDEAYFPRANHTFTERAMQRALVESVVGWLERRATRAPSRRAAGVA